MIPAIIIVDLYINNVYHVLEKEDLTDHRDFPRPDLISQFKNNKKSSQNGVYHSQFLSSTFW